MLKAILEYIPDDLEEHRDNINTNTSMSNESIIAISNKFDIDWNQPSIFRGESNT